MKRRRVAFAVLVAAVLAGAALTGAACRRGGGDGGRPALRTELSRAELLDKIKGGWAGQVIGCTFGGPTEFRFPGAMIPDYCSRPRRGSTMTSTWT